MLPLHQPIRLGNVELLFVLAVLQILVAAVLITDHKRLQVVGQVAA